MYLFLCILRAFQNERSPSARESFHHNVVVGNPGKFIALFGKAVHSTVEVKRVIISAVRFVHLPKLRANELDLATRTNDVGIFGTSPTDGDVFVTPCRSSLIICCQ